MTFHCDELSESWKYFLERIAIDQKQKRSIEIWALFFKKKALENLRLKVYPHAMFVFGTVFLQSI